MKNKKNVAIISIAIIGAMAFTAVGFGTFTRLPQNTADNRQLTDEGEVVNMNTYQDNTKDEVAYEENYEVVDVFNDKLYKIDMQGDVSVGVAFLNPIEEDNDYFNFGVALNTHSVDLDGYNLSQMTFLYVGDEVKITENIQWTMVEGGGHHVSGMIKVPREQEGTKLDYKDKEYIRLEIMNLDGVNSRVFEWEQDLF
ncbi:hypothetical protein [Alkaliphilus peptidifermentans]|uniref:Uncharacterized protein n=1 Tax=Alkaliphilus peptidifermentans DSM 18978 TaxID=1120976 RepID=A0A1G5E5F0_9FIRM|nr:hypothetical protein [Alkaliphilus peptidifermentans]SCY22117.1 hypothetical protein SAMN03080606_01052 [Alkaliphilus peptidifermentans DSM 18978]